MHGQGDPIPSYKFLLFAQILYLLIQQNKDIKGLTVHQYECKLTQFADYFDFTGSTEFELLGLIFINDMSKIIELNYKQVYRYRNGIPHRVKTLL